jgi:hypothetical protein
MRSTSPRAAVAIAMAGVGGTARLLCAATHAPLLASRPRRHQALLPLRTANLRRAGAVPRLHLGVPAGSPTGVPRTRARRSRLLQPFPRPHARLGAAAVVLLVVALFLPGADPVDLAAGALVVATLPLTLAPGLVFERFDLCPAFLALLAVLCLLSGRRALGLAALSSGAVAKLYPLALLPLAVLTPRGRAHVRRDLAVFVGVALAIVLPFGLVAPRGVAHVGWLLVRRPLHIESLGGSILLAAHRLGVYKPTIYLSFAGSWDLAGPAVKAVAVVSSLAEAAALAAVWLFFARGPRTARDLLMAVAAAVVGFVAFGKVFSPQYVVWVAAAAPLAFGRVRPIAITATVGAALLTRYMYTDGYDELLQAGRVSWVMLARNVVLVALFCSLLLELAARRRLVRA